MTILDFIRLTRANLKYLLAGLLIGALLGLGYSLLQPKVYASSSTGYVTVAGSAGIGDVISGSSAAKEKAAGYLSLANSRAVAERIVEQHPELNMDPSEVAGRLTATQDSASALIKVQATGNTPEDAQVLANSALESIAFVANELEGSNAVRVVPLEDALPNQTPISPNTLRNILLGSLAGFLAVYGAVFLRKAIDTKVRTRDDAVKSSGLGVLGMLPQSDDLDGAKILHETGNHVSQESIRQLRTNLRFVNVDNPPKSVLLTSSEPGEGKSTAASALAHALAESGQPTIIIDADLRRPTVAKKFRIDSKVGLTEVIAGQIELSEAVKQFKDSQLFILPAGRIPPNPSELLGSDKMRSLIRELSEEFMVIIDAPPVLPVTDAVLLSNSVDGVVLVVSVGSTSREHLQEASNNLQQVGAKLIGLVLNRVPTGGFGGGYYGFGYASSKGYTAYYGSDTSKNQKRGFSKKLTNRSK
ncbi:polysaccharide biosynthesis tyrosine autokinase [Rothia sp. ZJ932]|uniref:polysaccharide biosynthesis tyrosine autokinase n=1 Tax=Rothia sp. ZJ932 TaxID=2810516 RepID=UPI001968658F|nr:polysaccharide biosynthesis tyrosine autokinase [Rothia sp. ZJ932]QRZ61191.1 polysaccharide biosynthesis tyrosine autokinase [Rothia sp. ZJ932]